MEITPELLLEKLATVIDPEVGLNIVDMGLVYEARYRDGLAWVQMTLTTPGCPMSSYLTGEAEAALRTLPGVRTVQVELVWSPPWSPGKIRPQALEELRNR